MLPVIARDMSNVHNHWYGVCMSVSFALGFIAFAVPTPASALVCQNDVNGRACAPDRFWCGAQCLTQDELNTREASCPSGQTFTGCGTCTCTCPAATPNFCNGVCIASRIGSSCDAGSGPGSGTYADACGTQCVALPPDYVVFTPQSSQAKASANPAIWVNQTGAGPLLTLQGAGATILSVNRTGIQLGNIALDLGAATGGQNLFYGITQYKTMHANDALLLLQTSGDGGTITDRVRVDREGNLLLTGGVEAEGSVRGAQLCIGPECRSSWADVAPSSILLQGSAPGVAQTGNFRVDGKGTVGSFDVVGGIEAGSGDVAIVDSSGRIPGISATTVANLSGVNLTNLNASELKSGTVPGERLPSDLVRTTQATAFTAVPTGSGVLHGGLAVNPASASAGQTLFGVSVNGAARLLLDEAGTLSIRGGLNASGVGIIGSNGKIPAISSTYFANLSGANLTSLNATRLTGTIAAARLPSTVVQTVAAPASSAGPWVTLEGGGEVGDNIALRLSDRGAGDANRNVLEFAHEGASGSVGVARIRSENAGANAASGARLKLEAAPDASGTQWFTDQLVLDRNGNVGVGTASANERLTVNGNTSVTGNLLLPSSGGLLGVRTASPNSPIEVQKGIFHKYPTPGKDYGTLTIAPDGTKDSSASITFRGNDQSSLVGGAQAGIYVESSGAYGTRMHFGTTNAYSTGSQVRMTIEEDGDVTVRTGQLSVGGDVVLRGYRRAFHDATCTNQASCIVTLCEVGEVIVGGGCATDNGAIKESYAYSDRQWRCVRSSSAGALGVHGVCVKR